MRYQPKKDDATAPKQVDDRVVKGLDVFMNESFKNIKKESFLNIEEIISPMISQVTQVSQVKWSLPVKQ